MDEKTLLALAGVYSFYDRELSDWAAEVWSDAMGEFEPAVVRAAFQRHLRDPDAGQFLPKPADIIRQIRGSDDDAALVAWGEVLSAVRGGGSLPASGPIADTIASMGGRSVLARADESQNGFLQRRFCDAFKTYRRRAGGAPQIAHDVVAAIAAAGGVRSA